MEYSRIGARRVAKSGTPCGMFPIWGRSTFWENLECACEAYSRSCLTPHRKCSEKVLRPSGGNFPSCVGALLGKI